MKPVLGWLKSNVLLVIFGLLAVVPLPVAYVVAGGMNTSLVEERQQSASSLLSRLRSERVTYELPPMTPGEEPVSVTSPPNSVTTAFFQAERARREAQLERIKEAATERNRRGREPLVDGLFPQPAAMDSQLKLNEMARRAVAEGTPESAYEALFRRLRIRPPVDGAELGVRLAAQRDGKIAQITGDQGAGALTPEQLEQLDQEMWRFRIGEYRAHAQDTAFYGDTQLLPATVPVSVAASPPTLETAFAWQWDYWVIEDVLTALANANAALDGSGVGGAALGGVVKRVDSVLLEPAPIGVVGGSDGGRRGGRNGSDGPAGPVTLTGRAPGESAQYDIRYADVSLVAASAKLPALFDALASSNLITVLDTDLSAVDPWTDLGQGLYYGDDAVVRVDLRLELLYLRSWTAQWMPPAVREALGVADPAEDDNGLG
ncbi:MAG: hypothetical protein AAGF47_11880 [Planctomycetota bacterium]